MYRMFLDTQIWNYLVDSLEYDDDQKLQARERLVESTKNGEWEVICSLPVLQEILAIHTNNPDKYEEIKTLIFAVVANRWLKELRERYVEEVYNGGLLPVSEMYIGRDDRKAIKRLTNNYTQVVEVNDISHKDATDFKQIQEGLRKQIYTDLGLLDGNQPKKIASEYRDWFLNKRDLEGWVLQSLKGGVARKLLPTKVIDGYTPSYTKCPSAWQYMDFRQAKILLNLGENRAIKDSDAVDADIYGCSPYFNVLITEDRRFKETIELVVGDRFRVLSFKELMNILLSEVVQSTSRSFN